MRALFPLVGAVPGAVFRVVLSNASCRLFSSRDPACRTLWTVTQRARILFWADEIPAGVVSMADRAGAVHVDAQRAPVRWRPNRSSARWHAAGADRSGVRCRP